MKLHLSLKCECYFCPPRLLNTDEATVKEQLKILYDQSLIKEMEPGKWVRNVLDQKTGCFSVVFFHLGIFV